MDEYDTNRKKLGDALRAHNIKVQDLKKPLTLTDKDKQRNKTKA